jgi:hypothetical protein
LSTTTSRPVRGGTLGILRDPSTPPTSPPAFDRILAWHRAGDDPAETLVLGAAAAIDGRVLGRGDPLPVTPSALVRETGLNKRTVRQALAGLADRGEVEIRRDARGRVAEVVPDLDALRARRDSGERLTYPIGLRDRRPWVDDGKQVGVGPAFAATVAMVCAFRDGCWCAIDTIAARLGFEGRTVRRHLRDATRAGMLRRGWLGDRKTPTRQAATALLERARIVESTPQRASGAGAPMVHARGTDDPPLGHGLSIPGARMTPNLRVTRELTREFHSDQPQPSTGTVLEADPIRNETTAGPDREDEPTGLVPSGGTIRPRLALTPSPGTRDDLTASDRDRIRRVWRAVEAALEQAGVRDLVVPVNRRGEWSPRGKAETVAAIRALELVEQTHRGAPARKVADRVRRLAKILDPENRAFCAAALLTLAGVDRGPAWRNRRLKRARMIGESPDELLTAVQQAARPRRHSKGFDAKTGRHKSGVRLPIGDLGRYFAACTDRALDPLAHADRKADLHAPAELERVGVTTDADQARAQDLGSLIESLAASSRTADRIARHPSAWIRHLEEAEREDYADRGMTA